MQAIPPETSNFYMVMGYAVVVLILFGMVAYFANRARRLRSELTMLEELDAETPANLRRAADVPTTTPDVAMPDAAEPAARLRR